MNAPSYIIVVGTSAGGLKALSEMVAHIDPAIDAAVFIVMHLSPTGVSDFLLFKLQPLTRLTCVIAKKNMPIERGHIYIAPPKVHMLIGDDSIQLGIGPEENRWKPSIDVLFRSAAANWSNRVIGVVLTGMLDDGVAGIVAINKSGGKCVVQDPNEAEYPDMPLAVLNAVKTPYCPALAAIGPLLGDLTAEPVTEIIPAPGEVITENNIASNLVIEFSHVRQLGEQSLYACPDCGGGLWEIEEAGGRSRYRCHIGHAYSEQDLSQKQNEALEATLWVALRIMEERRNLLVKMERQNTAKGFTIWASTYIDKAKELQQHIDQLKSILYANTELIGLVKNGN